MYAVGRKLSCVCRAVCERDRERVTCVLILHTHRSSRWPPSGRQIFEKFCALRAQANFQSNFRKHGPAPSPGPSHVPCAGKNRIGRWTRAVCGVAWGAPWAVRTAVRCGPAVRSPIRCAAHTCPGGAAAGAGKHVDGPRRFIARTAWYE